MYRLQTPMLRRYWKKIGGILIEEFPAVPRGKDRGLRRIDGVIIRSKHKRLAKPGEVSLKGRHITIVQVESRRLGMYLMGQAYFSIALMKRFGPASIRSVALCEENDAVLGPLFERNPRCKVVVLRKP